MIFNARLTRPEEKLLAAAHRAAGVGKVLVGDVELVGQGVVRCRQVPISGARVEHEPRAIARDILEPPRLKRRLDGCDVLGYKTVVGTHRSCGGPLAHLIRFRARVARAACEQAKRQEPSDEGRGPGQPAPWARRHSNCSRW